MEGLKTWRRQQRTELIARRAELPAEQRKGWNESISALIEHGFPALSRMVIGFCWPYKGEFDARFVIRHFRERGAVVVLPAVVDKRGPLEFRRWWPGVKMVPEVYGIPVPQGTEVLKPDAVIVPMNGIDGQGYRLGYGGGYFDRTLASIAPQPIAIGVGYECLRMQTIYPQQHDIPMDFIVTEGGIQVPENGVLRRIEVEECARRFAAMAASRGLPRPQHPNRTHGA